MKRFRLLLSVALVVICSIGRANNINISNVTSVPGAGFIQLQFDLSWDNSWRNNINYDAAWVFFKFKDNDGTWRHLSLTGLNNVANAGYTINVASDLTGAMIYRTNPGAGNVGLTGMLVGVSNLPGSFDIKAFAIEMVNIVVSDQFYLGDGEAGTYYTNATVLTPYLVNSNSITFGNVAGNCYDGIQNGVLATGFPIGYNSLGAFYYFFMMKHEVSQGAYRDFLNTLTYTQQLSRTTLTPNNVAGTQALGARSYRSSIQIMTPGIASNTPAVYGCNLNNNGVWDEATDGEWIACGFLTYMDLAAFLDWAALRPMSELEYEKSCRGPVFPVLGENAAGTTALAAYSYSIINQGAANESVSSYSGSVLNANITYNTTSIGGNSPNRVGMHATPYANRISAGAGYYGCLDLSGNIEEYAVTTSNAAGRSFTGLNGDGNLNSNGDANVDYWPGINGNNNITAVNGVYLGATGITSNAGIILRGGSAVQTGANLMKDSYRIASTNPPTYSRTQVSGGRGVKLL